MDLSRYKAKSPSTLNPEGLTLERHTNDVMFEVPTCHLWKVARKLFPDRWIYELKSVAMSAAQYHDYGKAFSKWQRHMKNKTLHLAEYRHEFGSVFMQWDRYKDVFNDIPELLESAIANKEQVVFDHRWYRLAEMLAILSHHSKFAQKHQHRFEEFSQYSNEPMFKKASENLLEYQSHGTPNIGLQFMEEWQYIVEKYEEAVSKGLVKNQFLFTLQLNFIRSVLHLSDVSASAREEGRKIPIINPFSYQFPEGWSRTHIQKQAQQATVGPDNLAHVIWSSTGSGKTQAALEIANKYVEAGLASNVVILEPTQFTTNALYSGLRNEEVLKGVKSSDMSYALVHGQSKNIHRNSVEHYDEDSAFEHFMMDHFNAPIVVGTVDQFLLSFPMTREKHRMRMLNFANSVLVFDEFDYYNETLMTNMRKALEYCSQLSIPVIFMSATFNPKIMTIIQEMGYGNPSVLKSEKTKDVEKCIMGQGLFSRVNVGTSLAHNENAGAAELLNNAFQHDSTIIYANTVPNSLLYYEHLKRELALKSREFQDETKIILYHSYFTPGDRRRKEKEIISDMGKDVSLRSKKRVILVVTQIAEMSINITCDYMISDLCPIDRFSQRIGRLNRFDESKPPGKMAILRPYIIGQDGNQSPYIWPYVQDAEATNINTDQPVRRGNVQPGYMATRQYFDNFIASQPQRPYTYGELQEINEQVNAVYDGLVTNEAIRERDKLESFFTQNTFLNNQKGRSSQSEDDPILDEEMPLLPRGFINTSAVHMKMSSWEYESGNDFHDKTFSNMLSVANNYMRPPEAQAPNRNPRRYLETNGIVEIKNITIGAYERQVFVLAERFQSALYDYEYGFGRATILNKRIPELRALLPPGI